MQLIKRFAILIPGIVIAYVSWRAIFPYIDKRVPLVVAILATYILGAYVLIPGLIRLIRLWLPAEHLPLYCLTPDGLASDPLNIGLIGTRNQVISAMLAAGWHQAGPRTPRNLARHLFNIIFGGNYAEAPVSNLYLFGRKQDLAFEVPLAGGHGRRHHVRFWATTYDQTRPLSFQTIHWHRRRNELADQSLLWVGAASLDTGIGLIRHNAQLTHMIHPDTNQERELIIANLAQAGAVGELQTIKLGNPYRLINRVWRGYLHSDGRMAIVELKAPTDHHNHSRNQ